MLKIKMTELVPRYPKHYVVEMFDHEIKVATLDLAEKENFFEVDDFSVVFEYRRKGYGTKLIKFASQFAKKELYLLVYKANATACKFYTSVGFTLVHNCDSLYEATLKLEN
jgi:GNAT superfamily N-acetyltransferase